MNQALYRLVGTIVMSAGAVTLLGQQPSAPDPMLRENATVRVSDHVHVIPDFDIGGVPNAGIVVGNRSTLILETGLGAANAQVILRETAKVSKNSEMFLSATHYHPEHAGSAAALPGTQFFLPERQARDLSERGQTMMTTFAERNPVMAKLLKGLTVRRPDVTVAADHTLDLGGVRVRMVVVGPTHTPGDTVFLVEPDNVLFSGDVVLNRAFLSVNPDSSMKAWLAALDLMAPWRPTRIVPAHFSMGDGSIIGENREYLSAVQRRSSELKAQGRSVDEAATAITTELQAKYPAWKMPQRIAAAVRMAYAELP